MSIGRGLALAVALCLCGLPAPASEREPGPVTLTVLSTNDIHGALDGVEVPELAGSGKYLGGVEYLAGLVKALRARAAEASIVVDAGDCFEGPLAVNRQEGLPCVRLFNLIGYTATTIGNHEFDYGDCDGKAGDTAPGPRCALARALSLARYPVVLANVRGRDGPESPWIPGVRPYVVVEVAGVKVGITGVLTPATPRVSSPGGTAGLEFDNPVAALHKVLPRMRAEGAGVVIVLAHLSGECGGRGGDVPARGLTHCRVSGEVGRLLDAFGPEDIDLVVAGHSHAFVAGDSRAVPVMEAVSQGMFVGRATLRVDSRTGRVAAGGVEVLPPAPVCRAEDPASRVCSPSYPGFTGVAAPDPAAKRLREDAEAGVADVCAEVVGTAAEDILHGKGRETPLGNLTADLMLEAAPGADFAFVNAGAIRDSLRQGRMTACDVYRVWPFDDELVEVSMTGDEVTRLFRFLAGSLHKSPPVAGLTVSRVPGEGVVIRDAGGREPDPSRRYRVVTTNFLIKGGDRLDAVFNTLPPDRFRTLDFPTYRDAFLKAIRRRGTLHAPQTGRYRTAE